MGVHSGYAEFAALGDVPPTRGTEGAMTRTRDGITVEYDGVVDRLALEVDVSAPREGAPKRRLARAIIDTGAQRSMVPWRVARELGLESVGTEALSTVTGSQFVPSYRLDLHLCDGVALRGIVIPSYPKLSDRMDFVIGMDVISRGRLVVETACGRTRMELSFPPR